MFLPTCLRTRFALELWGLSRIDRLINQFHPTLVSCRESRRDFSASPPGEKLPCANALRFQFGANYMHVVKLKGVTMQPY